MEIKIKRTAREIKVNSNLINNKNINVKIGTVENRDSPDTIYIFLSFWTKALKNISNESQDYLKNLLNNELNKIYVNDIKKFLNKCEYFTNDENDIFIKNIPENINYNNKKNFISIELYLHTINVNTNKKIPLNNKKNTEMFNEAVIVSNILGNSLLLTNKKGFEFFKKSIN